MPTLEELVRGSDTSDEIARAAEIARGEWENIRRSLSLCGDAGEFREEDFMLGIISGDAIARNPAGSPTKSVSLHSPTYYPMYLVANLLAFSEKFPEKGYGTVEALYVYVELAAKAAARLGLEGNLGMGFACGYSNARTGWVAEKGLAEHAAAFREMFFSRRPEGHDWDFHWTSVKRDLRKIYDAFVLWRDHPEVRFEELKPVAVVKPFIV